MTIRFARDTSRNIALLRRPATAPRAHAHGFTMLELMVAVAVAAVLAAVAAPSLRDFGYESRLRARVGDLVSDLNFARLEAIKRNTRVLVCAKSAADNTCAATTDWKNGWIVCYDANGDDACDTTSASDPNPMKIAASSDSALQLTSTSAVIRFNPLGTSNNASALTLSGTWANSSKRTTNIAATGYMTTVKN
jgi:type IV fimbrial biogenesis protein FimT